MATTFKLKKSSVGGKIPTAGDLQYGELAINYADGKLYYKNSSNDVSNFIDSAGVQSAISDRLIAAGSLDSDAVATIVNNTVDTPYIQSRQITYDTSDFADSAFVTSLPVSTFTNDANYLDSDTVTGVIDSTYINNLVDAGTDSAAVITLIQANSLDSAEAVSIITNTVDSAYVQALQTPQDFAYSSLTGAPNVLDSANVSSIITADVTKTFVDNLNVDADTLDGQDGAYYLNYNNFTNTPSIFDSAAVQAFTLDSSELSAYLATNSYATQSNIDSAIAALVDTAPTTLDTLNELAAALNDDPNFATTVTNSLALKFDSADFEATFNNQFATKTTDNLTEGSSNLYYTTARADSDFNVSLAGKTTDDLSEGSSNLYYLDTRVDTYLQSGRVTQVSFDSDKAVMLWDSIEGTIDIEYANGVTLQVGQEQHFYAKASGAISNGEVVMFAGAQGDHLLISKADVTATGFVDEWVIGVATQDIANNDFGYVTSFGKVRNLNTDGAGWSEGDLLYLDPSTPGALTSTKPPAPEHVILMGAVTRVHPTLGTIFVRPTFGDHLNDLCDVSITSATNNQLIAWDSANQYWKNITPTTDIISEGSTNLFYTTARHDSDTLIQVDSDYVQLRQDYAYSSLTGAPNVLDSADIKNIFSASGDLSYNSATGEFSVTTYKTSNFNTDFSGKTTADLTEDTNLYYTKARVDSDVQAFGYATTTYVDSAITDLIGGAPAALDTLNELAAALNDDSAFSATVTNQLALKFDSADFESTFNNQLATKTTTDIAEGSNLYYTNARVDSDITETVTSFFVNNLSVDYNSLANKPDLLDLGDVSTLVDSNYVQLRQTPQDFAYSSLTGAPTVLDSDGVTDLIDSDYVLSRSGTTKAILDAVTSDTFAGDSSTTDFTLSTAPASDGHVIVAVNGVVQDVSQYSLSGSTLTFTTAPDTDDVVDARVIDYRTAEVSLRDYQEYVYTPSTSTSTFSGPDDNGVTLAYDVGKLEVYLNGSRLVNTTDFAATTGSSVVLTTAIDSGDTLVINSLARASVNGFDKDFDSDRSFLTTTASDQVISSFSSSLYRSSKYIIQVNHDSDAKYQASELLVTHNGTTAYSTEYAVIATDSSLCSFDVDINGGNVRLLATPAFTNTVVTVKRIKLGA